jgi:hypothetical protein
MEQRVGRAKPPRVLRHISLLAFSNRLNAFNEAGEVVGPKSAEQAQPGLDVGTPADKSEASAMRACQKVLFCRNA